MIKNYFYNLLLTLANLLFPIISFPYVSHIIGPGGIGKVQFVLSFAQYFGLIASIGIPTYGLKEIARFKNNIEGRSKVFSELIAIYLLTSVCLSLIYFVVIFLFPYFKADRDMYLAASLMVMLGFSHIEWFYSGMEEFKSIAMRSVLFKVLGLIFLFLLVKERADFKFYLYIMMFSFLGNNLLSFILIFGKIKPIFSGLELRRHLTPLLLILGTTLAVSMYTDLDTVLLGFLSDSNTVGLYTAAVKLSKITLPFVTSMGVILIPKVAKDFSENNLIEVQLSLNQTFRFLVFFSVPIVFGLGLLAPEFIALFSGEEFLPAINSMRILSLLPIIIGFGHFFLFLVLIPSGRNREMLFCVLGGLATSLILNVLLIPYFQEVGSSVANICSEVMVTTLYFYIIRKYFNFVYDWQLFIKAFISSLIFFPIIWFVRELNIHLVFTLIISTVGCAMAYVLIQLSIFRNNFVFDILNFVRLKFGEKTA
jgi:O-antigen/teichoic acid export membrane protein